MFLRKFVRNLVSEEQSTDQPLQTEKGQTPLIKAIRHNNKPAINAILKAEPNTINIADASGNSPLHYASQLSDHEITALLIKAGAKIDAVNQLGESALHFAVRANAKDNVNILLNYGADVNAATFTSSGLASLKSRNVGLRTPLHYAFKYHTAKLNLDIIMLLIDNDADLNALDNDQRSPLNYALAHPDVNVLSSYSPGGSLLSLYDIMTTETRDDEKLLFTAAKNNQLDASLFARLLEVNNNSQLIDKVDGFSETALSYAIEAKDKEKVEALLSAGANPNIGNKFEKPLHKACKKNLTDIAFALLNHGANGLLLDFNNKTPLYHAIFTANLMLCNALASRFKYEQAQGEEFIKIALLNGYDHILQALIACGISPKVHVTPSKSDASYTSTSYGSSSTGDGTDQTKVLKAGDTPLHYAVRVDNQGLAKLCIEKSPNLINAENNDANTPATLAIKTLNLAMARIIGQSQCEIETQQFYPDKKHKRGKTLMMQGISRGFKTGSKQEILEFFENPDYKLNPEQEAMLPTLAEKYKRSQPVRISRSSLFATGQNENRNDSEVVVASANVRLT